MVDSEPVMTGPRAATNRERSKEGAESLEAWAGMVPKK